MLKVLIADDQELIRQSLEIVLSAKNNIEVVGALSNGQEVIEKLQKDELPDVILMDIRMPKMDGVQCTKLIKKQWPSVKIIILTTFDDDEFVYNALRFGASGYLLKGVSMDELEQSIWTVHNGGAMINPDIATKVVNLFSKMAWTDYNILEETNKSDIITKAEWKIIEQVERGASNKEIAKELHLSEGTVRNYLSTILNKLELRDRTQLAIWAIQTSIGRKQE